MYWNTTVDIYKSIAATNPYNLEGAGPIYTSQLYSVNANIQGKYTDVQTTGIGVTTLKYADLFLDISAKDSIDTGYVLKDITTGLYWIVRDKPDVWDFDLSGQTNHVSAEIELLLSKPEGIS